MVTVCSEIGSNVFLALDRLLPLEGLKTRLINVKWCQAWSLNLQERKNDTSPIRFRVLGPHSFNHSIPKELRRAAVRLWRVQDRTTQEEYIWAEVSKKRPVDIDFLRCRDCENLFLVGWDAEYCRFCNRVVDDWPWSTPVHCEAPDGFSEEDVDHILNALGVPGYLGMGLNFKSYGLAEIPFPTHPPTSSPTPPTKSPTPRSG